MNIFLTTQRLYARKRILSGKNAPVAFIVGICFLSGTLCSPLWAQVTVTPDAHGIVYVKTGATGDGSGSSWNNACPEFADALKAAESNSGITQIWLAEGTWYPQDRAGDGDTDRDRAFVLAPNVKIYGGFQDELAASDTPPPYGSEGRNGNTILSGNIGDPGDDYDNAFHVLIAAGDLGTAAIDGLIIEKGNANGLSASRNTGGGLYIIGGLYNTSSIRVHHVLFRNNLAVYGGAIRNESSHSEFTDVTIRNNGAPSTDSDDISISASLGGGMYNSMSPVVLKNVVLESNSASAGGGIYNRFMYGGNSLQLTNVEIRGNTGTGDGGGMYNDNVNPVLTNTLISGNRAGSSGGGIYNVVASPVLTNVTMAGNYAVSGGGGMYSGNTSVPRWHNSVIWGNRAGTGAANVSNANATPHYAHCLVEGSGGSGSGWQSSFGVDGGNNIDDTNPYFLGHLVAEATNTPNIAGDYRITLCSPAYNAGDKTRYDNTDIDATKPDLTAVTFDLTGRPRIAGTHVDMGVYECLAITPTAGRIYVNKNSGGGKNDGSSWADATVELADALLYAGKHPGVTEIWTAEGVYRPLYNADGDCKDGGRNNAFVMADDVTVYGGFAGTETVLTQRNATAHPTVLSGDVGIPNVAADNAFHVVIFAGLSSAAGLDGVTVTGGNADEIGNMTVNGQTVEQNKGGGVYSD
ncbi:MAG: hypothetical protein LBF89_03345, partial [Bacteroidales bacterium]|nr:hypothetical protein [Bacteroidales bacterium]